MINDTWELIRDGKQVDPEQLWAAVSGRNVESLDHRSRLLARDALKALAALWGENVLMHRLASLPLAESLVANLKFAPDEVGFPSLRDRLMTPTDPSVILQMLRELGTRIAAPATIVIGGSIVLMLEKFLVRTTEDIDIVDELPAPLRTDHALLDELAKRYALKLTHFQSHYLPDGWPSRVRNLGRYGTLDVRVVDPLDILTGKLFSLRTKDLDDLRHALTLINRTELENRIRSSTQSFRADPRLLAAATQNWFILIGEANLPN